MRIPYWIPAVAGGITVTVFSFAQSTTSLQGFLGDVTLDGAVTINDVQAGISEALSISTSMPEADVNQDGQIDVRDVQHLVNSAIGNGGVFRRVAGHLAAPGGTAKVVTAVSDDGLIETAQTDSVSGQFALQLRTGRNWTLAVSEGATHALLGSVTFPVGGVVSRTLPVEGLSDGATWDLGALSFGSGGEASAALDLTGIVQQTQNTSDITVSELVAAVYPQGIAAAYSAYIGDLAAQLAVVAARADGLPSGAVASLVAPVIACANGSGQLNAALAFPLADSNQDDVPDIVEAIHVCFVSALPGWLSAQGAAGGSDDNANGIPDEFDTVLSHFAARSVARLNQYAAQTSGDSNQNGLPDWYENSTGTQVVSDTIAPQLAQFILEAVRQSALELADVSGAYPTTEERYAGLAQACFETMGTSLETIPPVEQWSADANSNGVLDVMEPVRERFDTVLPEWLGDGMRYWPADDANSDGVPDVVEQEVLSTTVTVGGYLTGSMTLLVSGTSSAQLSEVLGAGLAIMFPWIQLPAGVNPLYGFLVALMAQELANEFVAPVSAPAYTSSLALQDLALRIVNCAEASGALAAGGASGTDTDNNGVADMFDGIGVCIHAQLPDWALAHGVSSLGSSFDWDGFLQTVLAAACDTTLLALGDVGALVCDDTNNNNIPDCIESSLLVSGGNTNPLDANQNGIPDCFEDDDHDSIPNFLDSDNTVSGDADRDGIPDDLDWDDDNDGVPDYCDTAPIDPAIASRVSPVKNDLDGDGIKDQDDDDMDGDGVTNANDPAPRDPAIPNLNAGA